ncbi:hypothetical protein QBC32DRAFT_372310 [Pseudoneurospora amorphoporcata]|uniref:Uncharacterized protein n=1 Tax=Pseudoneurospora amorphoporcata TaxID=241081 RepID=A0AAN6SD88_9PEZI|nr:hypothetical protein QBC32DRAFT_372310 [Pseudoneurospora amorphoporcata]
MDNTNFPPQPPNFAAESLGSVSSEDAPSGDLVFLVGPSEEEVPADIIGLREVSSIALPDDDAFAMKAIFHALAFPGQFIRPATPAAPAGPSAREFLHLAVAIAKYKLATNMFVPWPRWFAAVVEKVRGPDGTDQEMVWLVAAAWALGQKRLFAELGLDLMVKHEDRGAGSLFRFCERDGVVQRVLPMKFWCKCPIISLRLCQLSLDSLNMKLTHFDLAHDGCGCGERVELNNSWANVYDEYGWIATVPLSELLRAAEPLAEREAATVAEECEYMGVRELGPAAVKEELKKFKREAKICFDCVLMDEGSHSVENSVLH